MDFGVQLDVDCNLSAMNKCVEVVDQHGTSALSFACRMCKIQPPETFQALFDRLMPDTERSVLRVQLKQTAQAPDKDTSETHDLDERVCEILELHSASRGVDPMVITYVTRTKCSDHSEHAANGREEVNASGAVPRDCNEEGLQDERQPCVSLEAPCAIDAPCAPAALATPGAHHDTTGPSVNGDPVATAAPATAPATIVAPSATASPHATATPDATATPNATAAAIASAAPTSAIAPDAFASPARASAQEQVRGNRAPAAPVKRRASQASSESGSGGHPASPASKQPRASTPISPESADAKTDREAVRYNEATILVTLRWQCGGQVLFKCKRDTVWEKVFNVFGHRAGACPSQMRVVYNGETLVPGDTVGDTIGHEYTDMVADVMLNQSGC